MPFTAPLDWMDRLRRTAALQHILLGRWTVNVEGVQWTCVTNGWLLVAVKAEDGEPAGEHAARLAPFIDFTPGPHAVDFAALKAFFDAPLKSCVCGRCGQAHTRRSTIDEAAGGWKAEEPMRVGAVVIQRLLLALALEELSAERVFLSCESESDALRVWAEDWRVLVMPVRLTDVERMACPAFPLPERAGFKLETKR